MYLLVLLAVVIFHLSVMCDFTAHKDFGHFYGSSYVAGPNGSRTPVSVLYACMY